VRQSYQVVSNKDSRQLSEFLAKEGQFLLPMLDLITQAEMAVDELIDVAGRATIEAVLTLSAQEVAGERHPGRKGGGEVGWHGRQGGEGSAQRAEAYGNLAAEASANLAKVQDAMAQARQQAQQLDDSINDLVADLSTQVATFGMSSRAAQLYGLQLKGATDAQLEQAAGLMVQLNQMEAAQKRREKLRAAQEDFSRRMFDIAADVDGSWPPDPDVSATIGLYRCTKPVPFEMEDGPSWNNWCNAAAWSTPGGLGDCELIGSLSVPHSHQQWPVFYRLTAGSAAFQAMVDGAPNVILARRADTGPDAVYVQVRCGIEFELNGPPS
jgi:hypothetical protein